MADPRARLQNTSVLDSCILIAITLMTKWWIVSKNNFFLWDDYSTLNTFQNSTLKGHITLLPQMLYNDRPIGDVFYYIVANVFNLNHIIAHACQLALHCGNGLMLYYVLMKLRVSRGIRLLAAFIFVANPTSTMCVQWTSAIFDLNSMFFFMAALTVALYASDRDIRNTLIPSALILFCYFLSVRSKEMTILLPVEILTVLLLQWTQAPDRSFDYKKYAVLGPSFVYMVFVIGKLLYLKHADVASPMLKPDNVYYISFNILTIAKSFFNYINLYFVKITYVTISFLAFVLIFNPIRVSFLLACLIFFLLAPVLPMVNRLHELYLYIPSFGLILSFSMALKNVTTKFKIRDWYIVAPVACILAVAFHMLNATPRLLFNKNTWLSYTTVSGAQAKSVLQSVPYLDKGAKILIYNIQSTNNIFTFYGPGNSLRLLTGIKDLAVETTNQKTVADTDRYDLIINFNSGKLRYDKVPRQGTPLHSRVRPENLPDA